MATHTDSKRTDHAREVARIHRQLKQERGIQIRQCDRAIERMIRTQEVR